MFLLVADDDIHVVLAAETVIGNREQTIHIGRQIDPRDVRTFVNYHIEKSRILMGEAIMILPPDGRSNEEIQRRNRVAPRKMPEYFEPLRVLVEHGIDDMYEGLIAGKKAMAAGQQIAFEHSFQRVLAQHF